VYRQKKFSPPGGVGGGGGGVFLEDASRSRQADTSTGQVACACECGDEPSGFIKCGEFLD
jgi:hypothetical protein